MALDFNKLLNKKTLRKKSSIDIGKFIPKYRKPVEKKIEEVKKEDEIITSTLDRPALGLKAQWKTKDGKPYLTPRSQDALEVKSGYDRDHAMSVWAGGTSGSENVYQHLKNQTSVINRILNKPTKAKNRQEGKMLVEWGARKEYNEGKISLNEARRKILDWNNQPEEFYKSYAKGFLDTTKETTIDLGKEMAGTALGVLDFLWRTGLQVTSAVGAFTTAGVVGRAKYEGDPAFKDVSYDEIWQNEVNKATDRAIDIGRPDEYFRSKLTGTPYQENRLFMKEVEELAKSSNRKMAQGDTKGSLIDAGKIGGYAFIRDWANPFYLMSIKGVKKGSFQQTPKEKVLWQRELNPAKKDFYLGKTKLKEKELVFKVDVKQKGIVSVKGKKVKVQKAPDVKLHVKQLKNGTIQIKVTNSGGDIMNPNMVKGALDKTEKVVTKYIKPGKSLTVKNLQESQIVDQMKLNPEMVKSRLNDIAQKINRNITGNFGTENQVSQAVLKLQNKNMDSPGKFYQAVDDILKKYNQHNPKNLVSLKETTKDFFLAFNYGEKSNTIYSAIKELDLNAIPKRIQEITLGKSLTLGPRLDVLPKEQPAKKEPLAQEAKKYKSAEEFVDSQQKFFHTTSKDAVKSIEEGGFKLQVGDRSLGTTKGKGIFLYEDIANTKEFGKNFTRIGKEPAVVEVGVKGKIFNSTDEFKSINALAEDTKLINKLKSEGYVGIRGEEMEIPVTFIFDKSAIKTKSQLTDIYNQATKEVKPPVKVEKPVEPPKPVSEKAFSTHYEKIKKEFGFADEGVEIERIINKETLKWAYSYTQRNPEKAMRIAYKFDKAASEVKAQAIRQSLVISLKEAGKITQAQDIAKMVSKELTESAQILNLAKADLGSERQITQNITQPRLQKIGLSLGAKPEKALEVAEKKIKTDAKIQSKKVNEGTKLETNLKEVDDLINSIIC